MTRFGPQRDLFAPEPEPELERDPLSELQGLLARLHAAEHTPWADAAGAIAEELRALGLARRAGPAGEALAASILEETERLLALAENRAG